MRMVVDLPAPLGPSTPKISPRAHLQRHVAHRHERAEAPRQMLGVDDGRRWLACSTRSVDGDERGHAGVQARRSGSSTRTRTRTTRFGRSRSLNRKRGVNSVRCAMCSTLSDDRPRERVDTRPRRAIHPNPAQFALRYEHVDVRMRGVGQRDHGRSRAARSHPARRAHRVRCRARRAQLVKSEAHFLEVHRDRRGIRLRLRGAHVDSTRAASEQREVLFERLPLCDRFRQLALEVVHRCARHCAAFE